MTRLGISTISGACIMRRPPKLSGTIDGSEGKTWFTFDTLPLSTPSCSLFLSSSATYKVHHPPRQRPEFSCWSSTAYGGLADAASSLITNFVFVLPPSQGLCLVRITSPRYLLVARIMYVIARCPATPSAVHTSPPLPPPTSQPELCAQKCHILAI